MPYNGRSRWRWLAKPSTSALLSAVLVAGGMTVGVTVTSAPAYGAGLVYQVTNYDNDGTHGVYLRNSSNINDVIRDAAHYVTYGTSVQLICAEWGSSVGPHANTAWDYVRVLSGPNIGRYGHLSEHWLNTPVSTNQHVSGEPSCGGSGPNSVEQKAISWAKARIGSTAWNGLCLSFVRNAYAYAGVDLRTRVTVAWGTGTFPQDIWGHFKVGRTGGGLPPPGALVFYLAKSGYGKMYSHVTLAVDGAGNTVSTNDTVKRTAVHYESIAQHTASGAYNYYVGWWLPA